MARRHSYRAHAASVAGATLARRGRCGDARADSMTGRACTGVDSAGASASRPSTSNPLSGPITVPRAVDARRDRHRGASARARRQHVRLDRWAPTPRSRCSTGSPAPAATSSTRPTATPPVAARSIIGSWMRLARHARPHARHDEGRSPPRPPRARPGRHPRTPSTTRCCGSAPTASTCCTSTATTPRSPSRRASARSTRSSPPARCARSAPPTSRPNGSSRRACSRRTACRDSRLLTTRYNLMERRPFEGAPELVAHAQGLAVLPYFALANGFLGGQVRRRSEVRHDARGDAARRATSADAATACSPRSTRSPSRTACSPRRSRSRGCSRSPRSPHRWRVRRGPTRSRRSWPRHPSSCSARSSSSSTAPPPDAPRRAAAGRRRLPRPRRVA